jgi:hypothetical protein
MRVQQSTRQVVAMWAGALVVFLASAWISVTILRPAAPVTGPTASYYTGLVGLLAIGTALGLTWYWVRRTGPTSRPARVLVQLLLVLGTVLWLAAMVFPFL